MCISDCAFSQTIEPTAAHEGWDPCSLGAAVHKHFNVWWPAHHEGSDWGESPRFQAQGNWGVSMVSREHVDMFCRKCLQNVPLGIAAISHQTCCMQVVLWVIIATLQQLSNPTAVMFYLDPKNLHICLLFAVVRDQSATISIIRCFEQKYH